MFLRKGLQAGFYLLDSALERDGPLFEIRDLPFQLLPQCDLSLQFSLNAVQLFLDPPEGRSDGDTSCLKAIQPLSDD